MLKSAKYKFIEICEELGDYHPIFIKNTICLPQFYNEQSIKSDSKEYGKFIDKSTANIYLDINKFSREELKKEIKSIYYELLSQFPQCKS